MMKPYSVSWYHKIHYPDFDPGAMPCWTTGVRCSDDAETYVAAVWAKNKDDAKSIIHKNYGQLVAPALDRIEWRFIEERPNDWNPFGGRFPRFPDQVWENPNQPKLKTPRFIPEDPIGKSQHIILATLQNRIQVYAESSDHCQDIEDAMAEEFRKLEASYGYVAYSWHLL